MEFFRDLFKTDFVPHGNCYFWRADVLWVNVVGDALISLSFFLIPFSLYYFVKRRKNLRFKGLFILFAAFIFLCGTTHLFDLVSVWEPVYRLQGLVKVITGLVSISAALSLLYIVPTALKLPTPADMARVNKELEFKTNELKAQNEFLRNLAYATYHDFREPARSMAINSQLLMLRHGDELTDETKNIVEHIATESRRMYDSLESTLNLTFLTSEKYEFERVNLNKIIQEVEKNLEQLIHDNHAKIICSQLPVVRGNESLLALLFGNIISNSIQFKGEADPLIRITVQEKGGSYEISIADNGVGFDNRHNKQVFEMFRRLGNTNNYRGSGLGLAICKKIVEIHKGAISALSDEGNGTTITFSLPM